MKKLILAVVLGATILLPTIAHAASGEWRMEHANGKIKGTLYKYDKDREQGQALTVKSAGCDGFNVRVKVYATDGGVTIEKSVKENKGSDSAWVKSYARSPKAWGSGHTTTPSNDPWYWLYLSV